MLNQTSIEIKPIRLTHRTFIYRAEETSTRNGMNFKLRLSKHSKDRLTQRGIEMDKLAIAFQYGQVFMKYGIIYYVLGDKNIPDIYKSQSSRLRNIVIVCCGKTDDIITCYRCSDPFKHIKIK
jgi:hypothetical protein